MKWLTKWSAGLGILLILALVGAIVSPSMAQDTLSEDDPSFTIVTGAVEFSPSGDILVAGIVIAPAGAFNPSDLQAGDLVIITGYMLNETTLQATSLEFFDDSEGGVEVTPEVTPEMTPESTPEMTPEVTPEMTPEATPEMTPEATEEPLADCGNPNHPIARRIADTFEVSYEEVMAMHCSGEGFGNIVRAYTLAAASEDGSTAQDFLDRHDNGQGWGQIIRDSGVHPSELAPGRVLKDQGDDSGSVDTQSGSDNGGSGNGNGHGNGNGGGNGNGHGNGNGGGNGNGNGNGGGNGNGHGNGGKP